MRRLALALALAVLILLGPLLITGAQAQRFNAPSGPCSAKIDDVSVATCFHMARRGQDVELTRLYGDVLKVLEARGQVQLRTAQRQWLKFRDAECDAERSVYENGTAAPLAQESCLYDLTRARIADLHAAFDWRLEKFKDRLGPR